MKIVYIYCEGQTEESFINKVLSPYFTNLDIYVTPIICTTKRTAKDKFKGGVSNYDKIKSELTILCKGHKQQFVTTMFDYYAMPTNTPMIDCNETDVYKKMEIIETAINKDIGADNCFFNLALHEFESMLFSSPSSFSLIAEPNIVKQIQCICGESCTPEHINKSPETAPSKRLEKLIPNYAKVKNGTILAKDMGIDVIMDKCKHFAGWIEKIKNIGQ